MSEQSKWVFVSPNGGDGWKVQRGGVVLSTHRLKSEAEASGIAYAKSYRTELVVQNMDGTIAWRNSYGNDPFPPRG